MGVVALALFAAGCGGGGGGSGDRIAFTSVRDGDYEIFVMNADGTDVRQLTNNDDNDFAHVWSPNGNKIAYSSNRYIAEGEIFVMNADGSDVVSLGQAGFPVSWGG